MNIFIITMDDPVQTNHFIKKIIEVRKNNIVGLAVSKGNRLTIQKKQSKYTYILALLLIMSFYNFFKNSIITINHKLKKILHSNFPTVFNDPSINSYAKSQGIKTWQIKTPNNKEFLDDLKKLNIDLIINQSQNILKNELLSIPRLGVINRHNALLPKNRGRLTPFWVLYNGENETGVSIHFVNEKLDAGDIIVQKRFLLNAADNFNSIVKNNYEIAPLAMLEAIEKLEKGEKDFIKNDDNLSTYNTTPSLKQAWNFRKNRIKKFFMN